MEKKYRYFISYVIFCKDNQFGFGNIIVDYDSEITTTHIRALEEDIRVKNNANKIIVLFYKESNDGKEN